jgi:prepilin-type processing-associated H-X9-DG protein
MHPGGTNFCMADGAVQFVAQTISLNVYKSLASRDGGEVAALP